MRRTRSGITKTFSSASASRASKSTVGAEGDSEGVKSPRSGRPKGLAQSRSDGMGTVGTDVGARDALGAAAKGSRGRGTRGGGPTREGDVRGTLPGPKP